MADIMVVATLLVLAAVASIVLTSSYKKLWRSVLKNGSTLTVVGTATKEFVPIIEKPAEAAHVVDAVQTPPEESRPAQDNLCAEPIAAPNDVKEKRPETLLNIEHPASIVAVEATQQAASLEETKEATPQNGRVRRKRSTARTGSTRRTRKKVSGAQHSTESQPPS